jgi:hypothetical protein
MIYYYAIYKFKPTWIFYKLLLRQIYLEIYKSILLLRK